MVGSLHHRRLHRRRWALARRRALDRDGWRCQQCGKPGRLEVDHLVPLEQGGAPYDLSNLQSLCKGCHVAKTTGERYRPEPEGAEAWKELWQGMRPA